MAKTAPDGNNTRSAVPRRVFARWEGGHLVGDDLEHAVWAAWVHNRSPLQSIGERKWLRLFKAAGFLSAGVEVATIDSEGSRTEVAPAFEHVLTLPVQPITVWRGASVSSRGRGMSWTLHQECAHDDFADPVANYGVDAAVWRATVPPRYSPCSETNAKVKLS